MKQAIECSKKIFENDQDEPLLGLISFTNFFVAEYDCEEDDRSPVKESALLLMYQGLADTSLWPGRQTFFHGYQQAVKDFFIM